MTYHTWDLPARQTLVLLVDNMPDLKCLWDADASLSLNGNSNLQLTFCKYIWIVVTTYYYRWFIIIIVTWRRGSKIAIIQLVRNSWKKLAFFFACSSRSLPEAARLHGADHLLPPRHTPNNTVTLTAAGEQLVGDVMPTLHTGTDIAADASLPSLPRSFHNLSAGRGASAMLPDSCVSYCRPLFWNLNPHRRFTLRKRCRN